VVAGAAVEDGVLAVLFGSEELHPAVVSATSTARTSRPLVVCPIAPHPLIPASKHIWWASALEIATLA
jgi:hypothetical protein